MAGEEETNQPSSEKVFLYYSCCKRPCVVTDKTILPLIHCVRCHAKTKRYASILQIYSYLKGRIIS